MNRIEKAINIFLDAINSGTLAKGSCTACAVGNLVAHGMNGIIYEENGYFECTVPNRSWKFAFMTYNGEQRINSDFFTDSDVLKCVSATDFTINELIEIEHAFEKNTKIFSTSYYRYTNNDIRKDQINGLAAVIKVMETFDNVEPDKYVTEFITKVNLMPA